MSLPFLPYAKQSIHPDDLRAVTDALKGELITRGPLVQLFEQAVADYCHVSYAVAFNSGTAALMAAYFAANLTSFDCVISTPNTFIASIGAALQQNICPRFVDIDRLTGSLNVNNLKRELEFRSTRGRPFIVPVHFAGLAIDMAALDALICNPEAVVIEDAAHAIGSCYPTGERVGSCAYSQMTIFSFHPAKTLTTGEGGMVTTQNAELYHRLLLFRDNGIERLSPYLKKNSAALGYYEVQSITGNFNLTSFQAALGLSQFKRLDQFILKRRQLVKRYRKNLKKLPFLTLFTCKQDEITAFHLFVVQIDFKAYGKTREEVMLKLNEKNIGTQIHYIPLYHHPIIVQREDEKLQYPETELYYEQALTLPLYYDLKESDVDRICHELVSILKRK